MQCYSYCGRRKVEFVLKTYINTLAEIKADPVLKEAIKGVDIIIKSGKYTDVIMRFFGWNEFKNDGRIYYKVLSYNYLKRIDLFFYL